MIETKQVRVGPLLASQWLERNVNNRSIRRHWVDALKGAFERGEYEMTHQGVAFSAAGDLVDGQHRLTAISEMPVSFSVDMLVTTGLPDSAFRVLDNGIKRSCADALRLDPRLVSVGRFCAQIDIADRRNMTNDMVEPYVAGVSKLWGEVMGYCPKNVKTWSSAPVQAAAILRLMSGGDRDYVLLTYHALCHSDFDAMSRIAQSLYRQRDRGAFRTAYDLFCRAYKTFDYRKASVEKLLIDDQAAVISEARELIRRRVLLAPIQKKAGPAEPAIKLAERRKSIAAAHV